MSPLGIGPNHIPWLDTLLFFSYFSTWLLPYSLTWILFLGPALGTQLTTKTYLIFLHVFILSAICMVYLAVKMPLHFMVKWYCNSMKSSQAFCMPLFYPLFLCYIFVLFCFEVCLFVWPNTTASFKREFFILWKISLLVPKLQAETLFLCVPRVILCILLIRV